MGRSTLNRRELLAAVGVAGGLSGCISIDTSDGTNEDADENTGEDSGTGPDENTGEDSDEDADTDPGEDTEEDTDQGDDQPTDEEPLTDDVAERSGVTNNLSGFEVLDTGSELVDGRLEITVRLKNVGDEYARPMKHGIYAKLYDDSGTNVGRTSGNMSVSGQVLPGESGDMTLFVDANQAGHRDFSLSNIISYEVVLSCTSSDEGIYCPQNADKRCDEDGSDDPSLSGIKNELSGLEVVNPSSELTDDRFEMSFSVKNVGDETASITDHNIYAELYDSCGNQFDKTSEIQVRAGNPEPGESASVTLVSRKKMDDISKIGSHKIVLSCGTFDDGVYCPDS